MTEFSLGPIQNLPDNWAAISIGRFRQQKSQTFNPVSAKEAAYELYSVPSHATGKPEIVSPSEIGSNKQHVAPGDVLISKINPRLNRTWTVGEKGELTQIASTEWVVFPRSEVLHPSFLKRLLSDYRLRDFLAANGSGVGGSLTRIRPDLFDKIETPLPPINEQRRIVEKIEAMFDEIDKGVESLHTARTTLGLYRQSLLKSAFEGRLTADWRAKNADKLEAPQTLLARIQHERDTRYKAALDAWQDALAAWRAGGEKGKKPTKPMQAKSMSKLAETATSNGHWLTVELGDIVSVSSGQGLTSNQMQAGPYSVYGGNGINGQHNDYFLEREELIIGRVGAKCGVTHITRPKSWVTDNALIVTPLIVSFDKRFFKWLLEFKDLNSLGSSTGQPVISGSKIYPVALDLPTLSEQTEIVRILEARLEAADALEAEINAALTRADALRQSILKKAFSGQLVPQDPEDEPASALLERIKANRARAPKKPRRKAPA